VKKILPLLLSFVFVLTFGYEFAEQSAPGNSDTGPKMIRDEDIQHYDIDQDRATVNQMPAQSGSEGSGAGGVTKDSDSTLKDSDSSKAPVEEAPAEPGAKGSGAGGASDDWHSSGY
jgi:hypothetical protein